MKRRTNIILLIILAIVILVLSGIFIYNKNYNITSNSYLTDKEENRTFISHTNQKYADGNMNFDFEGFTGKWSLFEIDTKKGNIITIRDNSNIYDGDFYILVLDSNYKKISMKEGNEKKDIEFLAEGEKYLIRIVGKDAGGHLDINITSTGELKTTYIDFWQ